MQSVQCNSTDITLIQPAAQLLVFVAIAVMIYYIPFLRSPSAFRNRRSISPQEIHNLESQALGVVSANLNHHIMGHYVKDPRRNMQLVAMWFEAPSFIFVILGSTLTALSEPENNQSIKDSTSTISPYFIIFASILGLASTGLLAIGILHFVKNRRAKEFQQNVLFPLIFDVGFIVISSSAIRMVTCQEKVDLYPLIGHTCTCFSLMQVLYLTLGLSLFFCLYFGALYMKMKREANALLVRVRFHSEFLVYIISLRTAISLYGSNRILLLSLFSQPVAHVIIGFVYSTVMLSILCYNYYFQPCLGSGMLANNIRALSFTADFASSVMVAATGIMELVGVSNESMTNVIWLYMYSVLPASLCIAWCVNQRRARKFHVPNLPISKLLETCHDRYRQVACEAACLIPYRMLSPDARKSIMKTLSTYIKDSSGQYSDALRALACKTFLHLQCLDNPDNPFGFLIEESDIDFKTSLTDFVCFGAIRKTYSNKVLRNRRHTAIKNFKLGVPSTFPSNNRASVIDAPSLLSDRTATTTIISEKNAGMRLNKVSKAKLFKLFTNSETSEKAVLLCLRLLHSNESEIARDAAATVVLQLFLDSKVTIGINSLFAVAFQQIKYDFESNNCDALETLHMHIVTFRILGEVENCPLSFRQPFTLLNVASQLDSHFSEAVRFAAEICLELLRLYEHWHREIRSLLGHPDAMLALRKIVNARKRLLVLPTKKHLVLTLEAAILKYFSIVVRDTNLESKMKTRMTDTKKIRARQLSTSVINLVCRKPTMPVRRPVNFNNKEKRKSSIGQRRLVRQQSAVQEAMEQFDDKHDAIIAESLETKDPGSTRLAIETTTNNNDSQLQAIQSALGETTVSSPGGRRMTLGGGNKRRSSLFRKKKVAPMKEAKAAANDTNRKKTSHYTFQMFFSDDILEVVDSILGLAKSGERSALVFKYIFVFYNNCSVDTSMSAAASATDDPIFTLLAELVSSSIIDSELVSVESPFQLTPFLRVFSFRFLLPRRSCRPSSDMSLPRRLLFPFRPPRRSLESSDDMSSPRRGPLFLSSRDWPRILSQVLWL